ncbi:MFS transporter [Streptomyces sp. NPDC001678]|uniref:MFS transporter n=1 Tax=Streptomyces sp. NPDC001678 TaxID=3364599 RepID=UPI0036B477BD
MNPGPPPDDSRARTATPGRVPCLAPFACHAALLCGALAIASVTAAVPAIAADLEMKPVQTQWFAAAYQLTCGPLQLGVSHFADRYGARRILLVARLVQGVGGAALSPVSLALLLTLRGRTESEPRVRAVAGWVSTAAAAACLGPVLGGLLTSLLGWRAVFAALTLLATVSAGCALHALGGPGPSPTSPWQAVDVVGIVLCTGAAVAALITLTAPTVTASAPVQASTGLLTATLTGLLVLRTRRHPQGALDAGLLRQAVTRRALLVLPALFGANSAFTFLTYFTLTRAYGLSPLSAARRGRRRQEPHSPWSGTLPGLAGHRPATRSAQRRAPNSPSSYWDRSLSLWLSR